MRVRSDGLGRTELIFKLDSVTSESRLVYLDGIGYVGKTKWKVRITIEDPMDILMLLKIALNTYIAKIFLKYLAYNIRLKKPKKEVVAQVKQVKV
jgi:hypothetical protein